MKIARQSKIKEIIDRYKIETQEDLAVALRREGIEVTQATVSRDIKEMMLVKVPDSNGNYHYAYPREHTAIMSSDRIGRTFQDSIRTIRCNDCMVVVHTLPGTAQAVAFAVDYVKWPEIIGTIAGDDTVFLAAENRKAVDKIVSRFKEYM